MDCVLRYESIDGQKHSIEIKASKNNQSNDSKLLVESMRTSAIKLMEDLIKIDSAELRLNKLNDHLESIKSSSNGLECLDKGLLLDLQGEVSKAIVTKDEFKRWGIHYLRGLIASYSTQQRSNFKDKLMQYFGGKTGSLFDSLVSQIEKIFCDLPAPVPSGNPPSFSRRSSSSMQPQSALNTNAKPSRTFGQRYYDPKGVCFDGNASVTLANGSSKLIKDVKKADQLMCDSSKTRTASVVAVVKTILPDGKAALVQMPDGMRITPYHPISANNQGSFDQPGWIFPCEFLDAREYDCPEVFNFVLDQHHSVLLNNCLTSVTLGHGYTKGILKHDYFGTQRIINDLKKIDGWDQGLVEMFPDWIKRDPESGLVCRISKD